MAFDRKVFYIQEGRLAEALELAQRKFDEIVNSLASSTDANVQLKEWLHFVVEGYIKKQPIRVFSREGAIAIANHIDLGGEATERSLKKVLPLLEQYRIDYIDGQIRQQVYDNSSSLMLRNQRHWLKKEDIVRIFLTNSHRLDKAFQDIQKSDSPMRINEDFEDYLGTSYFSLSGLEKFSRELSLKLRSWERRVYCERVKEVAPPVINFLFYVPHPSEEDIKKAINFVKNRDGSCQITGVSREKYNRQIELDAHHLYDKDHYYFLSADPDNIITIASHVHEDFHLFNGGNSKICTIDTFIEYIKWRYPQKHEVILMLHNRRRVLMLKLAQLQRALPEGK
ncbi:hypothetical protein NG798_05580 [Ancylothrix sp. C2]|uniref:hypothetical protein n=1 Tax=Ancylothrix sp. D3o TaxID=2953691 RepID=UPI0021BAE2DF|nr:hypothetical protein [Ancylothrix sp. D3o]MCT7949251.1 hypothetical protein [Ancylothrix sp. D3o]